MKYKHVHRSDTFPRHPVLVLGNSSTSSLGTIRAFGRRGIPVYLISNGKADDAVYRSRFITHTRHLSTWNEEALLQSLQQLQEHTTLKSKLVVIPTNDRSLLTYANIRHNLSAAFVDCLPSPATVHRYVNKQCFYTSLAGKEDLFPRTVFLKENEDQLAELESCLNYPFVLKPALSHQFVARFNTKLFVVNNRRELLDYRQRTTESNMPVMAQELIPGREFYLVTYFIKHSGEAVAAAGFRKIRQFPSDHGTGSLLESCRDEALISRTLQFLKETGLTGIGEVEYKFDPVKGQYKILEINARSVAYNRLPALLGIDFEYLYYLDALQVLPSSPWAAQENSGLKWVDIFKDLSSVYFLMKQKQLSPGELIRSYHNVKLDGYFARDDWHPFLTETYALLKSALRKMRRGL